MSRRVDLEDKPRPEPIPVEGFHETPLVSPDEAIEPLVDIVQDVHEMVAEVRRRTHARLNAKADRDLYGLTLDESDTIALYTCGNESDSLYSSLNKTLRDGKPRKNQTLAQFSQATDHRLRQVTLERVRRLAWHRRRY